MSLFEDRKNLVIIFLMCLVIKKIEDCLEKYALEKKRVVIDEEEYQ